MKKAMLTVLPLCLAFLLLVLSVPAYAQEMPITGLVLVGDFPLEAEILENSADEEGGYLQQLLVFDGAISIVTLRQRVDEAHPMEMPIEEFLSEYFEDMREDELLEANPVAAYPTERIRFVAGGDEDAAVIDAVLIRTDEFYFAFWADTQVDIYDGNHDSFEAGEVPELIDQWIESLDLFDAGESVETGPAGEALDDVGTEDGELAYWNGFDFGPNLEYSEEYAASGDPGDYLNAAEAAKLTFDAMRDNGTVPEYSDEMRYTMVLADLGDINGEECYVYRLEVDEPEGTVGAAYAYAYQSGNIYMQGHGGEWVQP